jgi:hypothetical protein
VGKASRKKVIRIQTQHPDEGKIKVSFTFDGVTYVNTHQMTGQELKHMKDLCVEFGDDAADQMIWKVAIRGMGLVGENIMAKAGLAYVKKHYKGPITTGLTEVAEAKEVSEVLKEIAANQSEEPNQ